MITILNKDTIPNSFEIPRKLLREDFSVFGIKENKLIKVFPKIEKINESSVIISTLDTNTVLLAEPFVGAYEGMNVQTVEK